MAQVSACYKRYSSTDRFGCPGDGSPEGEMFIVRLMSEPDHNHAPSPSGFVKIIQRHERSVVERIVSIELAQLNAFSQGALLKRVEHLEVIEKCQAYRRSVELT